MSIHPTAVIESGAEIDGSAVVGPYCVLGARVRIGPGTRLLSHVVVDNDTRIGARNVIHPFASIGGVPQDLKFRGEPARLEIGDDNVIREGVTISIGTEGSLDGSMATRVGNQCLIMAYAHVAHDCRLGNHVVLSNGVGLAGHVDLGDWVTCGGLSAVHQFCRIGRHAFVAGGGMVNQDVPPFCIAQGDRAELVGINIVGLKRRGFSREQLNALRDAFVQLFLSGATRLTALETVERGLAVGNPEVGELVTFLRNTRRGVSAPRLVAPPADNFEG